jgi:2-amino-4-hydroxy-6-hydroxymethyldihydropteridine diphosphokinase
VLKAREFTGFVRGPIKSTLEIPKLQFELQKLAFIALGSNLGDPKRNVLQAMDRLEELTDFPLFRSSLWQSTPVDCPPGSPMFVNAVVGLMPGANETPERLLDKLQSLEQELGRRPKTVLNEPRTLDLDLIAFRQETRDSARLTLPHPRAHLRRFVLQPLSEIAADLVLPGQVLSVRQLLGTLDPSESLLRLS